MNIWYISKYASSTTRHFHFAKEWAKLDHRVTVFTSSTHHKFGVVKEFKGRYLIESISDNFSVVWVKTYKSEKYSGFERIKSWLHFEWRLRKVDLSVLLKPDVVIISSLSLLTVINAYLFSKKYKAKFVFEVRDIWPLSAMILGGYSKWNPVMILLAWIEKFGYKNADVIVGTMPNLSAHVDNVIGKQTKTFCIPQGLSLDFYSHNITLPKSYVEKYIPKECFIVAYAGSLNLNNPLDTLINVAGDLQDYVDIHFLIVGEGYERENLIKKCRGLTNVSFPPSVSKEYVHDLLNYSNICYDSFESCLARYGLSRNKWIDYMFAAKPIICSYSGYKSMINESASGTFIPFGDTQLLKSTVLKYYKMDKMELKDEGLRGRNFLLSNRTFEKLAKDYLCILKN